MTNNKTTNNNGFTLIELIVGVVILGIIVVPLLHVFVTGMHISRKNEQYDNATIVAENIIENIMSQDNMTDILDDPTLMRYGSSNNPENLSTENKYCIGVPVIEGSEEYYAIVNLNTPSTSNSQNVCVGNSMDASFHMANADDDALSEYTMLALQAFNANSDNEGEDFEAPKMDNLNRKIDITATPQENTTNHTIDVVFTYSGTYGTVTQTSKALVSNVEEVPYGKAAFSVFLFYDSKYKLDSTQTINIKNKNSETMDFNVFLVAIDLSPENTTLLGTTTVNYQAQRSKWTDTSDGVKKLVTETRVFSNIPKANVSYYAYITQIYKKTKMTTGELTETIPIERMYNITVQLFPSKEDVKDPDKMIMSIDAETLG